jgi:Tol biopolymer transport system component
MDASGETELDFAKQVTNIKGSPGHPTWSADGKWIAFVAKEYDERGQNTMQGNVLFAKYHLYKVPSTGGKAIQLTSGAIDGQPVEDTWPSWSPDGKWIAFGRQYGLRRDVWLLDVATNKAFPLTTEGICVKPNWSYDGGSIYYASVIGRNYDIWVARDLTLKPPPTVKKSTATKPRPKTTSARKAAPPSTGK